MVRTARTSALPMKRMAMFRIACGRGGGESAATTLVTALAMLRVSYVVLSGFMGSPCDE